MQSGRNKERLKVGKEGRMDRKEETVLAYISASQKILNRQATSRNHLKKIILILSSFSFS